mgnify:CR=1 FL=1
MATIYEVSVFLWVILIGIVMPVMILSMILSIVGANAAKVMRKGQKDRDFVNRLFLIACAVIVAIVAAGVWLVFC